MWCVKTCIQNKDISLQEDLQTVYVFTFRGYTHPREAKLCRCYCPLMSDLCIVLKISTRSVINMVSIISLNGSIFLFVLGGGHTVFFGTVTKVCCCEWENKVFLPKTSFFCPLMRYCFCNLQSFFLKFCNLSQKWRLCAYEGRWGVYLNMTNMNKSFHGKTFF